MSSRPHLVIRVAAYAPVAHAHVQRALQQLLIVGADVDDRRHRRRRLHAAAGGVQAELGDGGADCLFVLGKAGGGE